jgi:hypothetical protein
MLYDLPMFFLKQDTSQEDVEVQNWHWDVVLGFDILPPSILFFIVVRTQKLV